MTSFLHGDANRAKKAEYAISLTLSKPEIFDKRYTNSATFSSIPVYATATYERSLRAVISDVSWQPTGSKSIIISVRGKNFFTGTQVALGDKTYAPPADGLILKSNETPLTLLRRWTRCPLELARSSAGMGHLSTLLAPKSQMEFRSMGSRSRRRQLWIRRWAGTGFWKCISGLGQQAPTLRRCC